MVCSVLICAVIHLLFLIHVTSPWVVEDGIVTRLTDKDLLLQGEIDVVLHGEHVYDLLFSRDELTIHDALIFLYTNSCQTTVDQIVTPELRRSLPDNPSLAIMKHDYKSTDEHIWWNKEQRESHNDFHRLVSIPPGTCSCYAYLPYGSQNMFDTECQPLPETQEDLVEQYWRASTFRILVLNRFDQPVSVSFSGKGPKLQELFLPSGSSTVIWAYPSYTAYAHSMENNDFLQGWYIIHRNTTMIEIKGTQKDLAVRQWEVIHRTEKQKHQRRLRHLRLDHAQRTLRNLFQPPVVHNFTETGFIQTKIPKDIYRELMDIYNSETERAKSEYYPPYYTFMNTNEVDIQQITLSGELSTIFSNQLRPMMEEFCQCKLKELVGRGIITRIRRYPNGSRLRMHVDELGSGHVIGGILHLTRDLDGHGDWPLEVIDIQGKSQTLFTKPGDMIIFESSRLVHGRPAVFQGKFFINVFFYYIPQEGWRNGQFVSKPAEFHPHPNGNKHVKTEL